jgi:hypothetical protein
MLKLNFDRAPRWLDPAPGVRLPARAPLLLVFTVAGETMGQTPINESPVDGLPVESVIRVAFVKAAAKAAILDWEGVGDATGEPIPPSPEAIDALMDIREIYLAFEKDYVAPGLRLDQEKNALPPAPDGKLFLALGAAGEPIATAADAPV